MSERYPLFAYDGEPFASLPAFPRNANYIWFNPLCDADDDRFFKQPSRTLYGVAISGYEDIYTHEYPVSLIPVAYDLKSNSILCIRSDAFWAGQVRVLFWAMQEWMDVVVGAFMRLLLKLKVLEIDEGHTNPWWKGLRWRKLKKKVKE